MGTNGTGCSRCYLPGSFPRIKFDDQGVCNFCRALNTPEAIRLREDIQNRNRLDELKVIAERIKADTVRRGAKYDCIIGASGGIDSTYIIYVAKKMLGLNPLVVKYDNGVTHEVGNENLRKTCDKLGIECRVEGPWDVERKFLRNATKALRYLGVFFTACWSCHYAALSTVYKTARKENIRYKLSATNEVEHQTAHSSHGFMLKSLFVGFLKALPFKAFAFLYYEIFAQWYMFRMKLRCDGFSLRLLRNQFVLHPRPPAGLQNIEVSDYVGWNMPEMEKLLREELDWKPPRDLKVPYMRFDCYYSALIDKSFMRITGIPVHALLANHFVQTGYISREELAEDMEYLASEERIRREITRVATELGVAPDTI